DAADQATIAPGAVAGKIDVTLNGATTSVDSAGIVGFDLRLREGANSASVALDLPTTVETGAGDDSITTGNGNDSIAAGTGDNVISTYTSGTIHSNGGNDTFDISAASDNNPLNIFAGDGDDRVDVSPSSTYSYPTVAHGGDGNDFMQGGYGSQSFYGDAGKD